MASIVTWMDFAPSELANDACREERKHQAAGTRGTGSLKTPIGITAIVDLMENKKGSGPAVWAALCLCPRAVLQMRGRLARFATSHCLQRVGTCQPYFAPPRFLGCRYVPNTR